MDIQLKKQGPNVKKLKGKTFHIVPWYDLLRKCSVCSEIKCIKEYDQSHRNLVAINYVYYNRKCKICRAAQIKAQRKEKHKFLLEKK